MNPNPTRPLRLALPLVALLGVTAAADVLVVDDQPGSPYSSVQAAIDAASEGDIVYLLAGTYNESCAIDGKSISIVADEYTSTLIRATGAAPAMTVTNIPANANVLFFALALDSSGFLTPDLPALRIVDCEGPVTVTSCIVNGDRSAISITNSDRVTLSTSVIADTYFLGAVMVDSSRVTIESCTVRGGSGADAAYGFDGNPHGATRGGSAVVLFGATTTAMIANTKLIGGDGGDGLWDLLGNCFAPQPGGDGLSLEFGTPLAYLSGGSQVGGHAGAPIPAAFCSPSSAADGLPVEILSGTVVGSSNPGAKLQLGINGSGSPWKEGETATIAVLAPAGSTAVLIAGGAPMYAVVPSLLGTLHVAPSLVIPLGTVPAGGKLTLGTIVPELGPGIDGVILRLQAVTCTGSNACALTNEYPVTLLSN